ncbi:PREDICTED: zinc finger protein ZIC 4 isoform X1 [Chinchilla lanigera]|uniref:zinc finger protein ZIC 4 isoform X1 n=1 Tax=Chinchilla lanigera TaxID=34839 RepID=UPI000696A843|nr:PREDICTED: zinc finger protein ZIC 4 isoform X1 [Chinchilla lanigera]
MGILIYSESFSHFFIKRCRCSVERQRPALSEGPSVTPVLPKGVNSTTGRCHSPGLPSHCLRGGVDCVQTSASASLNRARGQRLCLFKPARKLLSFLEAAGEATTKPAVLQPCVSCSSARRLGARYWFPQGRAPGDIHLFNSPRHLRPTPISAAFAARAGTWASGFSGSFPPPLACKFRRQGAPELELGLPVLAHERAFAPSHGSTRNRNHRSETLAGLSRPSACPLLGGAGPLLPAAAAHIPKLRRSRARLLGRLQIPARSPSGVSSRAASGASPTAATARSIRTCTRATSHTRARCAAATSATRTPAPCVST